MIEAYRIATNLVMDPTKVTGPLAVVIEAFERLLKVQRDVQSGINEMASGIRASRNAAAALADQMQRIATTASTIGRTMQGAMSGGGVASGGPTKSSAQPVSVVRPGTALIPSSIGAAGGLSAGSGGALVPTYPGGGNPVPLNFAGPRILNTPKDSDMLMAGFAASYAGRATLGAVGEIFDAGIDTGATISKMQAGRFTPAQIGQAKALARALVSSVPGLSLGQGLDLILQTASFTGDPDEAMKLAPTLGRDAQVLAQYGHKDAIGQIEQAVKAGELTGLTTKTGQINIPKLTDFVNRLTAVDVSSGGTMDLGKYLTSIRQYGIGADAASLDFVTAVLPAYQKIMGEAKAGTALSSLMQSLSSTKPNTQNKSYFAEQVRIGLRQKNGEVTQGDLLRSNANDWFEKVLLPSFLKDKKTSPQDQLAEFYKIFPRQTMVRLGAAGIFDQGIIEKESNRNRAQIAAGGGPLDALLASSPRNQLAAFSASLNLLENTLADPNMGNATGALKALTGALLGFSDWSEKHPYLAKMMVPGAAGAGAVGYFGGAALVADALARRVWGVGKWGADLFRSDVVTRAEGAFDAIDGSSIAGRAMSRVASGPAGKILGAAALPLMIKDALITLPHDMFYGDKQQHDLQGQYAGLVGIWHEIRDYMKSDASKPFVINFQVDGKTIATKTGFWGSSKAGVAGGTTQFDGKRSLPNGAVPFGGGN